MPAPSILVVDDQPINVQLLKRKLEREGLKVSAAYSGQEALNMVSRERPDLILLDVMMPEMDGIEVCQRLQAEEVTRSIPVIFITAHTSKEGRLAGLGVGAVDYITKPIDLDETFARIHTQLRFLAINREMLQLQRRLQENRRAATIGAITHGIAHNLNNLLSVATGYLELAKANTGNPQVVGKHIKSVDDAVQRIISVIRQLSLLVIKLPLPTSKIPVSRLLEGAVERFRRDHKDDAPLTVENTLGDLEIETNAEAFEDVLAKVLINAWESYGKEDFTGPRPVSIRTALVDKPMDGQFVEIHVEDQGIGIASEVRDTLFEPFISTKHTVGVGMGLTVARHTLRNLGGGIELVEKPSGGVTAVLEHPVEKKKKRVVSAH